jgi:hypothetical protein
MGKKNTELGSMNYDKDKRREKIRKDKEKKSRKENRWK